MVEKKKGMHIKFLRPNRGEEYFPDKFRIKRKYSCRYTPKQNGIIERKKRHSIKVTYALMNEKNMPNYY